MAIVNVSSKEKTVKSTYQLLASDNFSVDKFIYYCHYNTKDYQIEIDNILDNYRDYFETKLVEVTVPPKFYYQPAAFAENYYGTPDLDFLVLYFAKISTLLEFNREKIMVLPQTEMLKINRLIVEYKDEVQYSYDHPTDYMEDTYLKIY